MSRAKSDSAHCAAYGSRLVGIQVRRKRTNGALGPVVWRGKGVELRSKKFIRGHRRRVRHCPRDYKDDIVADLCETAVLVQDAANAA